MIATGDTVYTGIWPTIKLYMAVLRTAGRNLLGHKREDEEPFIPYVIHKDDVCLHIGATDGRHSYTMAKTLQDGAGYVLAFEPSPVTFPILERVIKLHGIAHKVKPARRAFSDKTQMLKLNVPYKRTGRLANSFGFTCAANETAQKGRNGEDNPNIISFDVQAITIDDVVGQNLQKVDFIRMDIEGSERLALNGGWETIKKFKPHLLIEIHPTLLENMFNASTASIFDDFKALGYDIYHLEGGKLVASPDLNIRPWKDYFFMHKDRPHNLPLAA